MRTIQAKPLTADAFRQYGTFWSAVDGEGYGLGGGFFTFYPDRIAVEQVVKEIIAVVQENEPTLLVMPESENGQNENQTWSSCVEEIIQMILLGEMHHRRWRYQQMNRRNY